MLVLWEMDDVLIDGTVGEGHQAGICQRCELWGEVARFDDDDLIGRRLKAKTREVGDIVVGTPAAGKDEGDAFDLDNRFAFPQRWCR